MGGYAGERWEREERGMAIDGAESGEGSVETGARASLEGGELEAAARDF